jgi:hypothetical protein
MASLIKIKKANFYHTINNRINVLINEISGHGIIAINNNQIIVDNILNPSGFQPLVYYKTGLLTGEIFDGSGFYTWNNLQLTGIGETGSVYLNYATGYIQASNTIEFIDSNGFGLENGDTISIANNTFIFKQIPTNFSEFNSPQNLANILNSGAIGALNEQGFAFLENSVGVNGYVNGNNLQLISFLRSGEDGNNIRVSRDAQNLDAIKIHSRYFTGGKTLRQLVNNWVGSFSNIFDLTIENSGFYIKEIDSTPGFNDISAVSWVDNFSGNYNILTGLKDPRDPSAYIGTKLLFNNQMNKYTGFGVIPSNNSKIYTGLNIEIIKPNPYNIIGNISRYIISGNNFLFSGIIDG